MCSTRKFKCWVWYSPPLYAQEGILLQSKPAENIHIELHLSRAGRRDGLQFHKALFIPEYCCEAEVQRL